MSWLWTTQALCDAMGGRPLGDMPDGVSGLSIDTRSLQKGDAFFAIRGDRFDGHDFASAAMAAGAGLLVVSEAKLPALGRLKVPMVVVDDVLAALERLAVASRARSQAQIIAVTGSAGKTTTKEALRHALSPSGKVHASAKSFNNHWGVPLSLALMPEDTDYGVFEIGMNHPGEITPLVKLVRPHVAIVTLIAAAHLGHFKNLDEIAQAKAEIFSGVLPGGYAVINRDDAKFKLLAKLAGEAGVEHVLGFGENARSDFKLVEYEPVAGASKVRAKIGGRTIVLRIGAPGRHIVQNALAVLGAAHLTGADVDKAAGALASLPAEKGRGARHQLAHPQGGAITLIDESYNANPASMRAALALLKAEQPGAGGRRIAVLGDMLELGKHSAKLHGELAGPVAETAPDAVFLAGGEMKALADALPESMKVVYRQTVAELEPALMAEIRGGDAVMIKSSNSIGFSRLVDAMLKNHPAAAGA